MKSVWFFALAVFSLSASAQIVDELDTHSSTVNRAMRDTGSLNQVQTAFDKSDPRENIKRYEYDPSSIYKIRLREYMNTTIVLPDNEVIVAESLGDTKNFEFVPLTKSEGMLSNIFDVKNLFPGADTNLTVIGKSGNIYSFYLRVDSIKSEHMPNFVTYIEDKHIDLKLAKAEAKNSVVAERSTSQGDDDYLRSLPLVDASKLYYEYRVAGKNPSLKPIRVFDDGYWTYFQYDGENFDKTKVPAVYKVLDGYDTPVNTRIVNGTVIAETTGRGFTLRAGNAYICVRRVDDDGNSRTASR